MDKARNNRSTVNDAILKNIQAKIHELDFGTITIQVHNSRIVQVEVSRKTRFDDMWVEEGGGI